MAALDIPFAHDPKFGMNSPTEPSTSATPTFRSTLIKVMAVQVGALLLLWLVQSRYTS
jgi:hypothetical protein